MIDKTLLLQIAIGSVFAVFNFTMYSKGQKTTKKKKFRSLGAWSKAVLKRDSKCDICGKKATQAHHLYSKEHYPKKQFNLDNGVGLCREHHLGRKGFHSWNGGTSKKATPKLYKKYKAQSDYTFIFMFRVVLIIGLILIILKGI